MGVPDPWRSCKLSSETYLPRYQRTDYLMKFRFRKVKRLLPPSCIEFGVNADDIVVDDLFQILPRVIHLCFCQSQARIGRF